MGFLQKLEHRNISPEFDEAGVLPHALVPEALVARSLSVSHSHFLPYIILQSFDGSIFVFVPCLDRGILLLNNFPQLFYLVNFLPEGLALSSVSLVWRAKASCIDWIVLCSSIATSNIFISFRTLSVEVSNLLIWLMLSSIEASNVREWIPRDVAASCITYGSDT
jgi:hypothetical protein